MTTIPPPDPGFADTVNVRRLDLPQREVTLAVEPVVEPLHAYTIGELLGLDIKPRGQILAPVIPEKGLVMLYGPRGTGKTHLGLAIAYAVATGANALRWQAPAPAPVLYIDGEMPLSSLQERLRSICGGVPPADSTNLRVLAADSHVDGLPNLTSSAAQAALEPLLAGVSLLVLDNLSSLAAVNRDNDAESWTPVQEWLLRLRRRGISVLLIHHAGKSGQQRGTSRREDVLDTIIALRRPADYSPAEGARFEVHIEKARSAYGDDVEPFEACLMVVDGKAEWTTRNLDDATMARIRALSEDGLSVREIAEETGISKSRVHRLKQKAGTGE